MIEKGCTQILKNIQCLDENQVGGRCGRVGVSQGRVLGEDVFGFYILVPKCVDDQSMPKSKKTSPSRRLAGTCWNMLEHIFFCSFTALKKSLPLVQLRYISRDHFSIKSGDSDQPCDISDVYH